MRLARTVAHRLYWRANEEAVVFSAQENSHFIETLRGIPSIKSLGIERRRQGIWASYLGDRVSADVRVARIDLVFTTLSMGLFGIDRILIIVIGAHAVMGNTLRVGMLVAFLAYKDQFAQRIGKLLDTIAKLAMLSVHGERIADSRWQNPSLSERLPSFALPCRLRILCSAPGISTSAMETMSRRSSRGSILMSPWANA